MTNFKDDTYAGGYWVTGQEQSDSEDDSYTYSEELGEVTSNVTSTAALCDAEVQRVDDDAVLAAADACDCCGDTDVIACPCLCHFETDASEQPDQPDEGLTKDIAPEACQQGSCEDNECENCAGKGLGSDQAEETYGATDDDFPDDDDEEDVEHFDSAERIGMLYEPNEPGILLASKEIRHECLPLYYALNSFSWRFWYMDHDRSTNRFAA